MLKSRPIGVDWRRVNQPKVWLVTKGRTGRVATGGTATGKGRRGENESGKVLREEDEWDERNGWQVPTDRSTAGSLLSAKER